MGYRIFGLVCLLLAAGIAWVGIWQPYQEALAAAPQVKYSIKTFVLVPFAAVFGLFFLLVGDSVPYRNAERQTPTAAGLLVFLLAAAASGATFWWFDTRFDALGYPYPGAMRQAPPVILPRPAGTPQPVAVPDFDPKR